MTEDEMNSRYRKKAKRNNSPKILMIPLFILLSVAAVKVGIYGGNLLFNVDSSIVEEVDTENLKKTLNKSFPLIDTVYNSGNVNTSFLSEIGTLVKNIFAFDINTPVTILNAQSPTFYSYYYKDYLPMLTAQREDALKIQNKTENNAEGDNGNSESNNSNGESNTKEPDPIDKGEEDGLKQDASSICYDEEVEEKDISNSKEISNGKIAIQNETKIKLSEADIEKLLKEPLKIKFDKKGPQILVYHTHTTESYLNNLKDLNKKEVSSWSQDKKNNVVRVGDELTQFLEKKYGFNVIHNGTIHDYPNYNLSYTNSLSTISKYLKSYPSIKMTLDLHRDAMGSGYPKLRVASKINGKNAARIMFVVGTNARFSHSNWKENLKLALKLQQKLNELYPGLAKPIYISKNRYNHHMSTGALTVEIGGNGNTLDEALESTKYLAKAISEVMK